MLCKSPDRISVNFFARMKMCSTWRNAAKYSAAFVKNFSWPSRNKHREEEDKRRKEWEKKRLQKRHSMATCGALEASQSKDELELTLEKNLRNTCRPLGRRLCRMRSLGWNNAKPCISYNDQDEQHCVQKSANQMRKISERVLRQQMEYKSQKSINIDSRLYQSHVEKNDAACQSESQVNLQKVSLLLSKEKTEIFQMPLEKRDYHDVDQPLSHSRSRYSEAQEHRLCNRPQLQNISELFDNSLQQPDTICPSTKESQAFSKSLDSLEGYQKQLLDHHLVGHLLLDASKSLYEQEINISSHHCTSATAKESSSHSEPKCNSQIAQKPLPIDSNFDLKTDQSHTQLNYVSLITETLPDLSNAQVKKQLIEKNQHDSGPGKEDQSYLQRQIVCLSAPQTFTYSESLVRLDSPVDEIHTRSVIQSTSESSMQKETEGDSQTVSNFKEISRDKLRNENSLQVSDHNHSDQSSDLQRLRSSKQMNELTNVSESSGTPKIVKPLTQVISKTLKQPSVKSAVRGTKHSIDLPGTPVSNPSLIPTRFDGSTQSQTANKSETPKLRRTQPGCFMSKIKLVEPLSVKQSFTKETNDYIPPNEKNVDPPNETSRGPQYMGYTFSKGVKDVHSVVQKDTHNPCSKWKRELRNTSEKANGIKAEPVLENSVGSNRNSLEHKSTNKNSFLGRNGKNIPKKSKMNDLGIRRVPLTKDLAIGSVSPSVIKQPVATPRHQKDSKDSKIPQKISLSNAGAGKTTPGKNMGTFKEKEGSHVNNNDCGKSETNGSPSLFSKPNVPTSLKGDAWTSQISPKKSSSVARVAIHVIKHCEVSSTLTRGTRNTYMDAHPIWR